MDGMTDDPRPSGDEWNRQVIEEFRENGGRVSRGLEGVPLLLLHHLGRHSGTERVNPVVYLAVGEHYAVFGSKAGADDDPDWYRNLLAHPEVSIEVGTETVPVRARHLSAAEREPIWQAQKQRVPGFADYEARTSRTIPVVLLERRE